MKIVIPHIAYTVYVKDIDKNPYGNSIAYAWKLDENSCELFFKKNLKPKDAPTVAHELVHVLQYICEGRGIDFSSEREHMGYIMQYMMNEILGYDYK